MRRAGWPGHVLDWNLGDLRSVKAGEGRNETVQLAVKVDVLDDLGAIGLEGGAKISEFDAGHLRHHPVGDARRDLSGDGVIDAVLAPAAGDVVALLDFREQ